MNKRNFLKSFLIAPFVGLFNLKAAPNENVLTIEFTNTFDWGKQNSYSITAGKSLNGQLKRLYRLYELSNGRKEHYGCYCAMKTFSEKGLQEKGFDTIMAHPIYEPYFDYLKGRKDVVFKTQSLLWALERHSI